jgi:hypothetical protein
MAEVSRGLHRLTAKMTSRRRRRNKRRSRRRRMRRSRSEIVKLQFVKTKRLLD